MKNLLSNFSVVSIQYYKTNKFYTTALIKRKQFFKKNFSAQNAKRKIQITFIATLCATNYHVYSGVLTNVYYENYYVRKNLRTIFT